MEDLFNTSHYAILNAISGKNYIRVSTVNGNIAVISRQVLDTIGFPDEKKFRHYGGDYEYGMRATRAGFSVILSSKLRASTSYTLQDVIRYMPPFLQWYIEKSWFKRLKTIEILTSLKSKYNIWQVTNMIHAESKIIPRWKYVEYYVRQVIKLVVSDFLFRDRAKRELEIYLQEENVPESIARGIRNRTSELKV